MSPVLYFHFISGLSLKSHLQYFNDTYYTTDQCKVSYARVQTLLFVCSYYPSLIDIVNCCNCCIFLLHFCPRKVALQLFEIFEYYLVPLYNRSIWSATCKNDNHTDIHFLIMSPDPYFYFISGLYLSNHLKYFNKTL